MRPDFIFFAQLPDEMIVADIVDPHGTQFSDALPKLRGLARYASTYGSSFRRVDAVAKLGDTFRVLDLKEEAVRSAVQSATSIKAYTKAKWPPTTLSWPLPPLSGPALVKELVAG